MIASARPPIPSKYTAGSRFLTKTEMHATGRDAPPARAPRNHNLLPTRRTRGTNHLCGETAASLSRIEAAQIPAQYSSPGGKNKRGNPVSF
jgi:hypothetical protein